MLPHRNGRIDPDARSKTTGSDVATLVVRREGARSTGLKTKVPLFRKGSCFLWMRLLCVDHGSRRGTRRCRIAGNGFGLGKRFEEGFTLLDRRRFPCRASLHKEGRQPEQTRQNMLGSRHSCSRNKRERRFARLICYMESKFIPPVTILQFYK